MKEIWKPVPGHETYLVSDSGDMWNTKTKKIVKGSINHNGYIRVCPDGRGYLLHRLILLAFVGPCPKDMQCCHNNGDRLDNRLENLRWDTSSANHIDKVNHGNHPGKNKTECPKGHPYNDANTYLHNGKRTCKVCNREAAKAYQRRKSRP